MSTYYDFYLFQHKEAVAKAFNWFYENLHHIVKMPPTILMRCIDRFVMFTMLQKMIRKNMMPTIDIFMKITDLIRYKETLTMRGCITFIITRIIGSIGFFRMTKRRKERMLWIFRTTIFLR